MRSSSVSNHRLTRRTARKLSTAATIESLEQRRLLTAILSDQTMTGSIGTLGEVDEFTFDAATGDSIVAFVAETTTANFDPRIELIAPDSSSLVSDAGEVGADIFRNSLPQTGTYTLRISDSGNNDTGDYAMTLAKLPGVQLPNSDGGVLTSGPRMLGTIGAGDLDVFTIAANAGDNVILSAADTGGTAFEPHILVYAPDGSFINDDLGDVGADFSFTAAAGGTYYVVMKDRSSDDGFGSDIGISTGGYALTMARVPGVQTDDGTDGGVLTSGPRKAGTIALGDLDVFTISANAGDSLILSIADTEGSTFEPQMFVYRPDGSLIGSDVGDVGADFSFTATASGTHYVVVKDWSSDDGFGQDINIDTGTYALTMAKLPGAQTDDATDGGALSSGPRFNGTIALGDLDVFTVFLNAGDVVILGLADTDVSAFVPQMLVYGPDGTSIGSDAGEAGADFNFTATSSGTHYVVVKDRTSDDGFGFDISIDAGLYALTMAKIPGPQSDDGTDGGALVSGQRVVATFAVGDIDVHTTTLDVGDSLLGVARGFQAGLAEPQMLLYSPTGTLLDSSNGSSNCIVNTNSVTLAGTYYVVIRDASADDGFGSDVDVEAGEYSFTFAKIPGAQPTDPDSGVLTSGAARAGAVSFGDLDVYTFGVTAGVGFTLNLAETATSGFDPTFTLYNPSGTVVTTQSGAASATFTVTNPAAVTGTYTVLVYDGAGEESGPYSIGLNSAAGSDTFAPRVLDAQYRFDQSPPDLRVIFSEHVGASFSANDVEIIDLATNQPVDNGLLSFVYDAVNDQFRVTFPALPGRVLPDGNYRLHIAAADLTDPAGNPLDQDLNHDFFVLAADANRDRRVSLADFNILAGNFGKSNRVFSRGDFNYDDAVTLADFNILAGQFGKMVAPAAGANALPPAKGSAGTFSERRIGMSSDRSDDLSALLA